MAFFKSRKEKLNTKKADEPKTADIRQDESAQDREDAFDLKRDNSSDREQDEMRKSDEGSTEIKRAEHTRRHRNPGIQEENSGDTQTEKTLEPSQVEHISLVESESTDSAESENMPSDEPKVAVHRRKTGSDHTAFKPEQGITILGRRQVEEPQPEEEESVPDRNREQLTSAETADEAREEPDTRVQESEEDIQKELDTLSENVTATFEKAEDNLVKKADSEKKSDVLDRVINITGNSERKESDNPLDQAVKTFRETVKISSNRVDTGDDSVKSPEETKEPVGEIGQQYAPKKDVLLINSDGDADRKPETPRKKINLKEKTEGLKKAFSREEKPKEEENSVKTSVSKDEPEEKKEAKNSSVKPEAVKQEKPPKEPKEPKDPKDSPLYQLNEKIQSMKIMRRKKLLLTIVICAAIVICYFLYVKFATFTKFNVLDEMDRSDSAATHFLEYGDGFVKYSNDGISYVTRDNVVYWNQSFEMKNPQVAVCGDYVAVADRLGVEIYIMNTEGLQGQVTVTMPILEVDIASQGTAAVLMENEDTCYLALYDAGGSELAEGAIHMQDEGTPIDIAISDDGVKLCASILDVTEGNVRSTLNFYNFGSAGQEEVDNLVSTYSYSDTVIQEVAYVSDDVMLAFADNAVYTYSGSDVPEEKASVEITDEIQSILYDDTYFGLVFVTGDRNSGRQINVYNLNCNEESEIQTDIAYDDIYFLDNHEICLYNSSQCRIYGTNGHEKLKLESAEETYGMYHLFGQRTYLYFKEGKTERVRLKLIDWQAIFEKMFHANDKADQSSVTDTEEMLSTEAETVE